MNRLLSICFCHLLIISSIYADDEKFENTPQLVVKGAATLLKPADQLEIIFDVVTENKDVKEAVKQNNAAIKATLDNLNKLGLTKEDYQTSQYQVQPIYSIPSKENEKSGIDHYAVHHTLTIKTQKLDLKNDLIGSAIVGGTNQINSLTFSLVNPQAYREEAIAAAAQNALANANALAKAIQVKISRVLYAKISQLSGQSVDQFPRMALAKFNDTENYSPSIQEGLVQVEAEVSLVLEIASL